MINKLATLSVLGLALFAATSTAVALDTIRTDEKTLRGDITSTSPTMVEVDTRGANRKIPVNKILSIRFGDEPDELNDARQHIRSGNVGEARAELAKINLDDVHRTIVKQDVKFLTAYCAALQALGGSGGPERPVRMMKAFVEDNPDSYRYFEANETLGDLAVAMGRHDIAMQFYGTVRKAPWPEAKLRVGLAVARSLRAQEKPAEAQDEYETILKSSVSGSLADRYRLKAKLGKAATMAETGQGEAAVAVIEGEIKAAEKGDTEIHARAYIALGDCYRTMDRPNDAVFQYLFVDTLYNQHPALHAEALYRLVQLWELKENKDRATQARSTLNKRYRESRWNKKLSKPM